MKIELDLSLVHVGVLLAFCARLNAEPLRKGETLSELQKVTRLLEPELAFAIATDMATDGASAVPS